MQKIYSKMNKFLLILISFFLFISCEKQEEIVKEKSTDSIFFLESEWENQDGAKMKLANLKGKNLVVVMIFTNCTTSCPILVADMKKVHSKISKNKLKDTSLVLVSIDPKNDTPEKLTQFAKERDMYGEPWIFLRSDEGSTREFANVLAMKYKQISPIEFSHSNIISVFDKNGELVGQEEGAGINSDAVAETVNHLK